jgi:hypothetical protein
MLLLAPAAYADENSAAPTTPKPSFDGYRAVIDRNIFSRRRVTPAPGGRPDKPPEQTAEKPAENAAPAAPPDPASRHVLVGISIVGGRATALVEDRDRQRMLRVISGEQLLDRTITQITFDRLHLQLGADTVAIAPGQTLAGGDAPEPTPPSTATPTTGESAASASTAPPPTSDAEAAILERLRQRRQQELNR